MTTEKEKEEKEEEFEDIPVVLRLKKNIAIAGKLIAEYHYSGSFDRFASEEIRQAILAILGPLPITSGHSEKDYPNEVRERINKLLEGEEI